MLSYEHTYCSDRSISLLDVYDFHKPLRCFFKVTQPKNLIVLDVVGTISNSLVLSKDCALVVEVLITRYDFEIFFHPSHIP